MEWLDQDVVVFVREWFARNFDDLGVVVVGGILLAALGVLWAFITLCGRVCTAVLRWVFKSPTKPTPATPRQVAYLILLGVPPNEAVEFSKAEASAKIRELKPKKRGR